jgi:hypothetical protein
MQRNNASGCHGFMKNFFIYFLLIAAATFFVAGCKKYALKTVDDNSIALHHCSENPAATSYICFDSLITDSRCPAGAECVWQGTAIVQVTFHEEQQLHTFKMSLKGFPSLGNSSDTTINGHRIVFNNLEPFPSINAMPEQKEMKATFTITQ